ncbi:MAG: LysR family transcriptional regulator [Clostridia bacterium]|nr:LysR family transcriptional regulator [Clostridia bacterium]
MNIKQVQYALVLSETLNFSKAAEQLGISQSALSKQIQNLERDLGVVLFNRNRSPLSLTPAGEYFIHNARELTFREEQLRKVLCQFDSSEMGQLTIGVTPFRSLHLAPDLIKKMRETFPGIKVTLHEVPSVQLRKDAAEGKVDFAIINLPVDISLMDAIPLAHDTLVLAVPDSMRDLIQGVDATTDELDFVAARKLPFVTLGQGHELRQLLDNFCSTAGFTPHIAAEVSTVTTAWSMVYSGVGCALMPLHPLFHSTLNGNVAFFKIKNSLYSRQPAIVTRRGQYLSQYAQYAINLLKETH